jgi:hypothetical protein
MCLLLQGNGSDHLELSYYAISSHLDNQNSRKHVQGAFFTHNDAVITRTNEVRFQGRNIFLQPPSPVRYHACPSLYAKLAKTNQVISRK